MALTPFQRGACAALTIGAPAVGRLYRAICETPGLSVSRLEAETGVARGNFRLLQLERAGLITTRMERVGGRLCRLCFPVSEELATEGAP